MIIFLNYRQKFVHFDKIGKNLSKWLMVKHDILLSTENNQEDINQILNNIYEIDKKIKEYDQYINEYKSSKIIEKILIDSFGTFFSFILSSVK
jgi:response regulator of citrate/malate metabolism